MIGTAVVLTVRWAATVADASKCWLRVAGVRTSWTNMLQHENPDKYTMCHAQVLMRNMASTLQYDTRERALYMCSSLGSACGAARRRAHLGHPQGHAGA